MTSQLKSHSRPYLPGSFLVASPYLPESPYRHSVVLVMHHDSRGALGFVLDDQLKTSLVELDSFFRSEHRDPHAAAPFPGIRMFSAIVRWPEGRLEAEVEQGIWMTTPGRLELAVGCDDLWENLVRQIGRDVLTESLGIEHFPLDPTLN